MSDIDKFRFSIDRGGTFTDIYAEVPGEPGYRVVKLLSEDPQNYDDAPREGIRRILASETGREISPEDVDAARIEWIRMGTTVATNALLERKGARCALLITRGFGDILQIGNQDRPNIFDLEIRKPDLLYEAVAEVDERLRIVRPEETEPGGTVVRGITGDRFEVLEPLDVDMLRPRLQAIYDDGIRSLAVVLMHAYAWPDNELAIGRLAEAIGFTQISLSSQVMPRVKLVARGDTTMVDAYLNPHIRSYLESFREGFRKDLAGTRLLFMQSDGGLAQAGAFTGSRAILSGPAGGVVGCAMTAFEYTRGKPVIGFDMGGTSTDVSRFGGDYELVFETETAGVRIQAPQLHIKTVAAGGGSRLFFENNMFMVGPESAGAHPGPVCYRKGGPLAVTDANLVLGRLQPKYFPHIFGTSEDLSLDLEGSRAAMREMAGRINDYYHSKGLPELTLEQVALGFVQVANEVMVRAIREISVMRGFDIKEHVLATFGGAGPQHACSIARALGIEEIFVHRYAGILSAYGMGLADVVVDRQKPSSAALKPQVIDDIETEFDELRRQAYAELYDQGFDEESVESTCFLNLRYDGTDTAMMIARPSDDDYARVLRDTYLREFGFDLSGRDILIDDIRVRALGKIAALRKIAIDTADGEPEPLDRVSCFFEEGWLNTTVYDLKLLGAGHHIQGPALALTIDRRNGSAALDFTGTGPEIWGNCNAPKAVTTSAVLYCLRCLIEKELPLNHGCLIPIRLNVPKGSLLDPSPDAAVVGGNVLTSQRVVDVILRAFGVAAASQGCMNNFTFGNDRFGYYETIGGGAGAGPTWHGQSGVHTHMTNTRITDPEILERRYPILLREFALRRDSGGKGRYHGGEGLAREVEFLEPLNVAILSERRVFAPYGLEGGAPGGRGVNLFFRSDGSVINLGAKNEIVARPGERLRILTPGGGGYGEPAEERVS